MYPLQQSKLSNVALACPVICACLAIPARGWGQGPLAKDLAKVVMKLDAHFYPVDKLALSSDGKCLFSGSLDGRAITVWDSATGTATMQLERERLGTLRDGVMSLAVSADGQRLFMANLDIRVWDLKSRKQVMTLQGDGELISSLALAKDGKRLYSGSGRKGTIKGWDLETGKEILTIADAHRPLTGLVLSLDNKRLFSGGDSKGKIKVWDIERRKQVATLSGHTDVLSTLVLSEDGKRLYSGSVDATIKVWDVERDKEIMTLRGHGDVIAAMALSKNGKRLVACGRQRVSVWDLEAGKLAIVIDQRALLESIALSDDGKRIYCGTSLGTIMVWEIE